MSKPRFDPVGDFAIPGKLLNKLAEVSRLLDDPKPLTWDQRRDAANLINLLLSEAAELNL